MRKIFLSYIYTAYIPTDFKVVNHARPNLRADNRHPKLAEPLKHAIFKLRYQYAIINVHLEW